jgi:hypothetical protein
MEFITITDNYKITLNVLSNLELQVSLSSYYGTNPIKAFLIDANFLTSTPPIYSRYSDVSGHITYANLPAGDYYIAVYVNKNEYPIGELVGYNLNISTTPRDVVKPDLIVSSITPANNIYTVTEGDTFSFDYVIQNIGNAAAGYSYSGIYLDGQSQSNKLQGNAGTDGYDYISSMDANTSVADGNWFSTTGLVGSHTLWIQADNDQHVDEGSELNNWRSISFTVQPVSITQPDLSISSFYLSSSSIIQGSTNTVTLNYTIKNLGSDSVSPTSLGIYVNDVWKTGLSVPALSANGGETTNSYSLDISSYTAGTIPYTVKIKADDRDSINNEISEDNNTSTAQLTITPINVVNQPPVVNSSLQNQTTTATEGSSLFYLVPPNTFSDTDALTYSATQTDGSSLPAWLNFDKNSHTLFSTSLVPTNVADLNIRVTATDTGGSSVSANVVIYTDDYKADATTTGLLTFSSKAVASNIGHIETSGDNDWFKVLHSFI